MLPHKLELLVLQPTSYCNLNCSYCYLPDRDIAKPMPERILDAAFQKVLGSPLTDPDLILLWHAGEPLVVGLPFYERAVSLVERYRPSTVRVEHSIQTNATLITDDWCNFFRDHQFHIGVSLDGPQFLHDRHRRNWANHGSFEKAMAGVNRLRHHGIPFGVLAVVTADSLQHADEIYDFFKAIGSSSVGFNVEEIENAHVTSTFSRARSFSAVRSAYRDFFARLLKKIHDDSEPLRIREIEHLLKAALRIRKDSTYVWEPLEAAPLRMLTILQNGDVTPFSPEFGTAKSDLYDDFKVGNICQDSLEEIARRLEASLLRQHTQASRDSCQQNCRCFQMCGGTYFSNKWSENGNLLAHETQACRLHSQAVIDAFLHHIDA